jgi:hypothetical protein
MRETSQLQRYVNEDNDLYIEFANELKEPFGTVQMRAEQSDDRVICRADWGGWNWRAEGVDRMTAQQRLSDRLSRLDPFEYTEDWGLPGYQTGALDEAIPPTTRQRMRDFTQREARSAVGLLEAVFEAQARRPWAFPPESAEILPGLEIEGYVCDNGSLALFPRTFYEIAGAYFGRTAPQYALAGPPGSVEARSSDLESRQDHPGLAGALRRLTEKGYMHTEDARLPHQIHSIEVYVFRPQP